MRLDPATIRRLRIAAAIHSTTSRASSRKRSASGSSAIPRRPGSKACDVNFVLQRRYVTEAVAPDGGAAARRCPTGAQIRAVGGLRRLRGAHPSTLGVQAPLTAPRWPGPFRGTSRLA
jgi:hypothetical protein